jgi:hypothetical protein
MLDPPPAPAHKKLLPVAAKVARLPHHVERLRFAVDDDADRRLAREGREGRGGCPLDIIDADARGSFDEGAWFAWFTADAEGCGSHGGNSFTTSSRVCGWKGKRPLIGSEISLSHLSRLL